MTGKITSAGINPAVRVQDIVLSEKKSSLKEEVNDFN
jgi:hypothetical protein